MGFGRFLTKKTTILLGLIFLLAILIRFLYFPDNTYFAYDAARDSFGALEILHGDLKIVGPPTSVNGNLFHGPLFYYFLAPIYFLFDKSPEAASFFLRILNASGVFLVFLLGLTLFNESIGLLAAFLFAISHEQSQYALFFGHPTLAVILVLLFYFGLARLFFKNDKKGLIWRNSCWFPW